MPFSASRFLDPVALAALGDLHLRARTVVEGFLAGLHLDARSGAGVEFQQFRAYQPGDDPRRIDWRAASRSDRYVVREAEVERDVTVRFLLDASASMAHGMVGDASGGEARAKFDLARTLVACLAYLADHQGDHIALHVLGGGMRTARRGRPARGRALRELLHELEGLEPSGEWPPGGLEHHFGRRRGAELVVVVSDLWERGDEIRAAVRALRVNRHEVVVFHLLARDELDFSWQGDLAFEDLETGERVRGNADSLRAAYLERLKRELEAWRRDLLDLGASYARIVTDEPLERALREFLAGRCRLP